MIEKLLAISGAIELIVGGVMQAYPHLLPKWAPFYVGWFVIALGALSFGSALVIKQQKDATTVTGDSYNNSGNNFGHMGPVNNYGKQPFEFNEQVARALVSDLNKSLPIKTRIIGSQRSIAIGHQIVSFLKENGYTITGVETVGMYIPLPSSPLSFDGTTLTIAADL